MAASGHPAKQDPKVQTAFQTMKKAVNLTKELQGDLSDETYLKLRASALGLMFVYAELTGLPAPDEYIN